MKTLKTAPELERYILLELRKCGACASVGAVTVSPRGDRPNADWDISHIYIPGGIVPSVCAEICAGAAQALRQKYDLLTDIEADEL
jgi:hypothetical protein